LALLTSSFHSARAYSESAKIKKQNPLKVTEIFGQVSEMRIIQHRFNVSKRKFKSSSDVGTNINKIMYPNCQYLHFETFIFLSRMFGKLQLKRFIISFKI